MMRRLLTIRALPSVITVIGGVLVRPAVALAQCAMCGAAAASSSGVARGIALSIFFLLGTLFLVVGWLVVLVLRGQSRARRVAVAPAAAGSAAPIAPSPPPTGHAPARE